MSLFKFDLAGGHVLVTGGTKGIGRCIVRAFLEEGVTISFCARTVTGDEFWDLQDNSMSARAFGTAVDISSPAQIKAWVEKAVEEHGPIDAVVANACPGAVDPSPESWERSFQADIMGLITLIEAATPHLEKRSTASKTTSFVVISSCGGFERLFPVVASPYTTFKRAQATIARDYVRKLGPKGIRINTIIPSVIENPTITKRDGTVELSTSQIIARDNPEFVTNSLAKVPLKRFGKPEDIASTVLFLTSGMAGYISGANLLVDGGQTLTL